MALRLIGAVGIKVRPEAEHFRDEAERDIKRQMRDGMEVPTRIRPEMDRDQLKRDFDRHKKAMQREIDRTMGDLHIDEPEFTSTGKNLLRLKKELQGYKKHYSELTKIHMDSIRARMGALSKLRNAEAKSSSGLKGRRQIVSQLAEVESAARDAAIALQNVQMGNSESSKRINEYNAALRAVRNELDRINTENRRIDKADFRTPINGLKSLHGEAVQFRGILGSVSESMERFPRKINKAFDDVGMDKKLHRVWAQANLFRKEWDRIPDRERKVLSVKLQMEDNDELEKQEAAFRRFRQELRDMDANRLLKQMRQIRGLTERERSAMSDEWNRRLDQIKRVKAGWEQINSIQGNQNRDNERIRREYEDNLRHVKRKAEETRDYIDDLEADIHVGVDGNKAAAAQMKWLTRPRKAMIHAVVSTKSLAIAEGLLNSIAGVNALKSLGQGLEKIITDFDKFSIKAAGWTTLIGSISNAAISGAAALFSIGDGLVRIVGLGAMAPTMFGALGTSVLVATTALKGFFSALKSGDSSGLLETARKEVEAVKGTWTELSDTIQEGFWSNAGRNFSGFILDAMPTLNRGLGEVAAAMGKSWDNIFAALRHSTDMGYLDSMFDGLSEGMMNASNMMGPLVRGIMRLGARGSEYLPQFGDWLTEIGEGFENWINKADEAGDINRWIEDGVQAVKDLGNVTKGTGRVLSGFAKAALAAGGPTLTDLANGMLKVGDAMHSAKGQFITREIFAGAMEGWSLLSDGLGDFFSAIGDNIGFVKELEVASGKLGGTLFTNLSDVLRNEDFTSGVVQGFNDIGDALQGLRPSFGNMGTLIGDMARLSGGVFKGITPTINAATDTISEFVHELSGPVTDLIPRLTAGMGAIIDLVDTPIQGGGRLISGIIDGFNKMPAPLQTAALSLAGLLAMRPQIRGFGDAIMNRVVPATSRFGLAMNKLQAEHANAGKNISKTTAAYRTFKQEMAASSRLGNQAFRGMGRELGEVSRRLGEYRVIGGRAFADVGGRMVEQTGAYNRLVGEQRRLTSGMKEAAFATTRFGSAFSALDQAFGGQTRFTEVGNGLVRIGEGFRNIGRSASTGLTTATSAFRDFTRSTVQFRKNPLRFDTMFNGLQRAAGQAKRGLGQIASGAGNAAAAIGMTAGTGLRKAAGGLLAALGGGWGLAITGAAIGVGMLAQKSAESKQRIQDLQSTLDSTGRTTLETNQAFQQVGGSFNDVFKSSKNAGISIEQVNKALEGDVNAKQAAVDKYREYIEAQNDASEAGEGAMGVMAANAGSVKHYERALDKASKEVEEAKEKQRQLAEVGERVGESMGRSTEAGLRAYGMMSNLGEEMKTASVSGKTLLGTVDEVTNGMIAGQDAAFNYQTGLAGMKEAMTGWTENYGEGIKGISKTLEKNNGMLDMTKQSHRELYSILRSQIEPAYQQVADAFNRAGGGEKGREAARKSMSGIRDDWMSMLTDQVGMTDEAASNMLDALNINPDAVEMVLESGGVEDKLDEISNSLKIMSGEKTVAQVEAEVKGLAEVNSFKRVISAFGDTKAEAELSANDQELLAKLKTADGKLKIFETQKYLAKLAAQDDVSGTVAAVRAALEGGFVNKTYKATLDALDNASGVAQGVRDKIMAAVVNQDFEAAIKLAKDANIDGDLDGLIEKLKELDAQDATPGINEPQGAAAAQGVITNLGMDLTGLDGTTAMPTLGLTDNATEPMMTFTGKAVDYDGSEYAGQLKLEDFATQQLIMVQDVMRAFVGAEWMIPVSANINPAMSALAGLQGTLAGLLGYQYQMNVGANTTPAVVAVAGLQGILRGFLGAQYQATISANTTPAVAAVAGLQGIFRSVVMGNYMATIRANTTPAVAAAAGLQGTLRGLVSGNYTATLRANATPAVVGANNARNALVAVARGNYQARITANSNGVTAAANQALSAIRRVVSGHYQARITANANGVYQGANQALSALRSVPRNTMVYIQARSYGLGGIWGLRNAIASVHSKTVFVRVHTYRTGGAAYANGGIAEAFADGGFSGVRKGGLQNQLRNPAIRTIEQHTAQIAPAGAMRVWAEPETGGEAYIPLAKSKRTRSEKILGEVANRFGMSLEKHADGSSGSASGGTTTVAAPANGNTYNVNIESVPTDNAQEVSSQLMFDLKHMQRGGYSGGPN